MTGERPGEPLVLEALRKSYGPVTATADVSLRIAPSEFVSLLGPSGSGKTTTLMMIAGFILPDEGRILIGPRDVTRVPPYRRNIGMVHQSYALFPHMTIEGNVGFPLRMRGLKTAEIREKVARALELVRLTGLNSRKPAQLSGGQQQRVALARALVFEPPLLLMDEPLGALDKKLRAELQVEIRRIQRESGSTMVYVTHDQEEALSMSDRIAIMNHGRVEQVGTPTELYERPGSRFVADFLGIANFLDAVVEADGDRRVARTRGGVVAPLGAGSSAAPGARVTLTIRPERLRLGVSPSPGVVTARATVVDSAYFGTAQRYGVRLPSGETLTVLVPNTGAPMFAVGSEQDLSWRVGDTWVVPSP